MVVEYCFYDVVSLLGAKIPFAPYCLDKHSNDLKHQKLSEMNAVRTGAGLIGLVIAVIIVSQRLPHENVPTPSAFVPEGYHLVFNDEFDNQGLDLEKWAYRFVDEPYLAGYNTHETITQPGDGLLHLNTLFDGGNFLTGMIQSKSAFQYGYFEARIRFQSLQGHHGAFWLQSPLFGSYQDDPGRSGAEIDIVEFFGNGRSKNDAQQNVYWNAYSSSSFQQRSHDVAYRETFGDELSADFHVFGLLWTREEYIFSIDGVETWRTSDGLSHVSENIVLSLITSDWEVDRLDPGRLPDEMLVDYVRVYSR